MKNHMYTPAYKVLVWRENVVNNRTGKFVGLFTMFRHNELSSFATIDQNGVIKKYFTSQIRLFIQKPSVLDDDIVD